MSSKNFRNNQNAYQNQSQNQQIQAPKFPGYYKDGKINTELFNYAEKISEYWSNLKIDGKKIKFTKSQIRNIYNEVKFIERILKRDNSEALIRLNLLKAKIRYNEARDNNKFPKQIGEEIIKWLDEIKESDFYNYFNLFSKLFEAVVGFSYEYAEKN